MDFRDPPWSGRISISSDVFEKDIYWLISIFHASASLSIASEPIRAVKHLWQESEVLRLLLNIAVVVRNRLDAEPRSLSSKYTDDAGFLIKDITLPNSGCVLSFREACNKIIHSERVTFDYHESHPKMGDSLKPVVAFYGALGKKSWKATVDIDKFSTLALVLK